MSKSKTKSYAPTTIKGALITLRQYSGHVFGKMLIAEGAMYVRVVKSDLIKELESYGLDRPSPVEFTMTDAGLFVGPFRNS